MRSSSILAFRAPARRSRGVQKCRGFPRGPTTTAAHAAELVSRGCSPGESGVAGLAAAAARSHEFRQPGSSLRSSRRARISWRDRGAQGGATHGQAWRRLGVWAEPGLGRWHFGGP